MDVLSGDWKSKGRLARPTSRALEATRGTVVEDVETGWVGAVVALVGFVVSRISPLLSPVLVAVLLGVVVVGGGDLEADR